MATDRARFVQLADDARIIQSDFKEAVVEYRRAIDGFQAARDGQLPSEPWPQSELERCRKSETLVGQYWEVVRSIASETPLLLPDLESDLVHVWLGADPWHSKADFPWEAACAELRRIENAARRRAELDDGTPVGERTKGMPLEEAEIHAARHIAEHNRANPNKKMTLAVLVGKIRCSEGTAHKTAAWRAYHEEWERRHPPKPKAVSMSDPILAVKGETDATLEALIAEQTAELKEDDKLVSKARHHRRRTNI